MDWDENTKIEFAPQSFLSFSTWQKIEFLSQFLEESPLSVKKLQKMQELYDLSSYTNSEIRFRWIRLGLRGKWQDAISKATQMVSEQGRLKFTRPLYR